MGCPWSVRPVLVSVAVATTFDTLVEMRFLLINMLQSKVIWQMFLLFTGNINAHNDFLYRVVQC